jgi:hypothetical protein
MLSYHFNGEVMIYQFTPHKIHDVEVTGIRKIQTSGIILPEKGQKVGTSVRGQRARNVSDEHRGLVYTGNVRPPAKKINTMKRRG